MHIFLAETDIKATQKVLEKYRNNGCDGAMTCTSEIAEALQIDNGFAQSRPRKKRRVYDYEAENECCEMSQENQFKANFFLTLIDYAMLFKRPL